MHRNLKYKIFHLIPDVHSILKKLIENKNETVLRDWNRWKNKYTENIMFGILAYVILNVMKM